MLGWAAAVVIFNTLHHHCSLQSKFQVTHIPSISSIILKTMFPSRWWRRGSGGLMCQSKRKSKPGPQRITHCWLYQSLSDLFPFFFLILVHCWDDQVCMLTLAQGAEEVSMGKPEHVSTGYRQERKQFCLPTSFSGQRLRAWPWHWRLHELLQSFSVKQRLREKISHLFYAWYAVCSL